MVNIEGKHKFPDHLAEKFKQVKQTLTKLQPGLIAVSGGVDSRLLVSLAWAWNLNFQALFMRGPHMTTGEIESALTWLAQTRGTYHVMEVNPLDVPEVAENNRLRCYYCRLYKFGLAKELAAKLELKYMVDGTQASDLDLHRPGIKALRELGVFSPLAHAGVTKEEIRKAGEIMGLSHFDQPGRPCMLTRLAYGLRLDIGLLESLSLAEDRLMSMGLKDFRLRVLAPGKHALQLDRAEKDTWDQVQDHAMKTLRLLGFYPLDLVWSEGVSGFFDRLEDAGAKGS